MKRFEIISHPANPSLFLEASTQEELFKAALEGLSEMLSPGICEKNRKNEMEAEEYISILSDNTTHLLLDFLSEVLTRSYLGNVVFCEVDFPVLDGKLLKAKIGGTREGKIIKDVKVVTHHKAEVVKNKNGNLETAVVFDM